MPLRSSEQRRVARAFQCLDSGIQESKGEAVPGQFTGSASSSVSFQAQASLGHLGVSVCPSDLAICAGKVEGIEEKWRMGGWGHWSHVEGFNSFALDLRLIENTAAKVLAKFSR
eukprot:9435848-Pyramimonas_sp.AAC.1